MRILLITILTVILIVGAIVCPHQAHAQLLPDNELEETLIEDEDEVAGEDELGDEELEEGEEIEEEPGAVRRIPRIRVPFTRTPRATLRTRPEVFTGESDELVDEARKINIFGDIELNYVMNEGTDSFIIKYVINIDAEAKARTAVWRGKMNAKATVDGYVLKFRDVACSLDINIPNARYEMTYSRKNEERADLIIKLSKMTEDWTVNCDFGDESIKPFVTKGEPENWLSKVLARTSPPLRRITAKLGDEKTNTDVVVKTTMFNDPPIGTIEAKGKLTVTIAPESMLEEMEEVEELEEVE